MRVMADYACLVQNLTDLGLPINGSEGIFLNMSGTDGWTGDAQTMPEAW